MAIKLYKANHKSDIKLMAEVCGDDFGNTPGMNFDDQAKYLLEYSWWYNAFEDDDPKGYLSFDFVVYKKRRYALLHFGLVERGDVRTVVAGWREFKKIKPKDLKIMSYITSETIERLARILKFKKIKKNLYIYKG